MRLKAQAKMGYYPTPEPLSPLLCRHLRRAGPGTMRIFDPCAGTGVALKVLADLPERIRRHPELFVLGGESAPAAAERIGRLHAQRQRERFITYTRSDGTPWRLSLADIYARRPGLEVAYNPNDCVERRWGASPDSADYATCRRQAPAAQRALMEKYRPWFRDTRRPPR